MVDDWIRVSSQWNMLHNVKKEGEIIETVVVEGTVEMDTAVATVVHQEEVVDVMMTTAADLGVHQETVMMITDEEQEAVVVEEVDVIVVHQEIDTMIIAAGVVVPEVQSTDTEAVVNLQEEGTGGATKIIAEVIVGTTEIIGTTGTIVDTNEHLR